MPNPSTVSPLVPLVVATCAFVGVFRLVSQAFGWLSAMLRVDEDTVARGVMIAMAGVIPAMAIGIVVLNGLVGTR